MSMDRVIARLRHTDTAALDAGGLAAALRDLQQVRGFVSSTELALARRADELAAADRSANSTPNWPSRQPHRRRSRSVATWTADQGETNLDSLIPSCSRHHHLLHEGRWRLELDATTRELTITLPDSTVHRRSRPDSVAAPTAGRAARGRTPLLEPRAGQTNSSMTRQPR